MGELFDRLFAFLPTLYQDKFVMAIASGSAHLPVIKILVPLTLAAY